MHCSYWVHDAFEKKNFYEQRSSKFPKSDIIEEGRKPISNLIKPEKRTPTIYLPLFKSEHITEGYLLEL